MNKPEDAPKPENYEQLHCTMADPASEMLKISLPFIQQIMKTNAGDKIALTFFELGPEKGIRILASAFHSWFSTWLGATQEANGVPVGAGLFEVKSATVDPGLSPFGMHDRVASFDTDITFGVMKNSARMLAALKSLLDNVHPSYDADGMRTPSGGHIPQRVINEAAKIVLAVEEDDKRKASERIP